jgi:hypothetical protein
MQEEIHKRLHASRLGPCACSQVRRLGRKHVKMLAALTQLYLELGLPVQYALRAAEADLQPTTERSPM